MSDFITTKLYAEIEDLKDKIVELEGSQPKWISVDDRLPEEFQEVLSFAGHNGIAHSIYRAGSFKKNLVVWEHQAVTHWMPLPEQPKNKGGAE